MIVWINGSFGAGKTQTAYELHRRLPGSYVYDPENVGCFLRRNMPKDLTGGDFQNIPLWREFNYWMLKYVCERFDGTIIVPMTLVDPAYFAEIVGRLRSDGVDVRHYTLRLPKEEVRRRLRRRGERKNSWAEQQVDRCIAGLAGEEFRQHLDTEHMPVEQVAEAIAASAGLLLLPNDRSKWGRKWDRLKTQLRHIRLFGRRDGEADS
jgi:hypothetical protein